MKSKNSFIVAYNVQTSVDSETHMIKDYLVTNQVTDHGLIGATVAGIKENEEETVVEAVADKGYNEAGDMAACLEDGIIPHVILADGKDTHELEISYEDMGDSPDTEGSADRISILSEKEIKL